MGKNLRINKERVQFSVFKWWKPKDHHVAFGTSMGLVIFGGVEW